MDKTTPEPPVDELGGDPAKGATLAPNPIDSEAAVAPRFLQLADVAEMLSISSTQAYALVRSGELPAIKVGGRGQWRVEVTELEAYIQRMYAQTRAMVESQGVERDDETV